MSTFLRRTACVACIALALGITGCATTGMGERGKTEAALLQRANAYWTAVKDNDRATAWNYEEVSIKPDWTLQAYLRRGGIVYEAAQVQSDATIEGNQATVNVKLEYSVPQVRAKNIHTELPDKWVWLNGQWYHAHRPAFQ